MGTQIEELDASIASVKTEIQAAAMRFQAQLDALNAKLIAGNPTLQPELDAMQAIISQVHSLGAPPVEDMPTAPVPPPVVAPVENVVPAGRTGTVTPGVPSPVIDPVTGEPIASVPTEPALDPVTGLPVEPTPDPDTE